MTKIDFTSTAIEKGIDLAKDFLDKLIIPSVEEVGLLIKDHVTLWRFNNQIKMLNKAKLYCEKHNIQPKTISLKLLCPLLEYSSLEEKDELQDKWAILLTNMVDSEQNIENHVFPYILSQISSNEFGLLENVYDDHVIRQQKLKQELEKFQLEMPVLKEKIQNQIIELENKIKETANKEDDPFGWNKERWKYQREKENLEQELRALDRKEYSILFKISEPQIVPDDDLKEFEISNLNRLGLIKYVQKFYAASQTLEIPYEFDDDNRGRTSYANVDLDVDLESEEKYVLTELGQLFIKACKLKQ